LWKNTEFFGGVIWKVFPYYSSFMKGIKLKYNVSPQGEDEEGTQNFSKDI